MFRFIGDGFQWLEADYQFYGVGERVENQPDKDYGGVGRRVLQERG